MKIGTIAENQIEQDLLEEDLLPVPGVFEALASEALTAIEVATRCWTHPDATKKLLDALVGAGYLRANGERYELAPVARRWLLKESPQSLYRHESCGTDGHGAR